MIYWFKFPDWLHLKKLISKKATDDNISPPNVWYLAGMSYIVQSVIYKTSLYKYINCQICPMTANKVRTSIMYS